MIHKNENNGPAPGVLYKWFDSITLIEIFLYLDLMVPVSVLSSADVLNAPLLFQ